MLTEKPEEYLKKEPELKLPLLIGNVAHETANGVKIDEITKIFKSGTEFLKATATTLKLGDLLIAPTQLSSGFLGPLGVFLLNLSKSVFNFL